MLEILGIFGDNSRLPPVRIGIIRADKRGMVRNNHSKITQKSINFYMFSMFFHNESIVNMRSMRPS